MADTTFRTVLPPLKAVDNGDGTFSLAVVIESFSGPVRLDNNVPIQWRNAADDAWLDGIRITGADLLQADRPLQTVGELLINLGGFALTLTHAITGARVITFPDATDTVAVLGQPQTFTGAITLDSLILGGGVNLNSKEASNSWELIRSILALNPLTSIMKAGTWTATVVGTGTTADTDAIVASSGATAGGSGLLTRRAIALHYGATTSDAIDWAKEFSIFLSLQNYSNTTNGIARFQVKESNALGILAQRGIGLEIRNLALWGEVHDGTTRNTVDLATTLASNRGPLIELRWKAGTMEWLVNGVSKGTTTTNVPAGAPAGSTYYAFSSENGADNATQGCTILRLDILSKV